MKVYVVYETDGDSCAPPIKVFRNEKSAKKYCKPMGYTTYKELEVEDE